MIEEHPIGAEYDQVIKGIARLHREVNNTRQNVRTALYFLPTWLLPHPILAAKYKHAREKVKYLGKEFGVNTINLSLEYAHIFGEIFGITTWSEMVILNFIGDDFEQRELGPEEDYILTHMREYAADEIGAVRASIVNGSLDYLTTNRLLTNFSIIQGMGAQMAGICVAPNLHIEGIEKVINSMNGQENN